MPRPKKGPVYYMHSCETVAGKARYGQFTKVKFHVGYQAESRRQEANRGGGWLMKEA